MRIFPEGVREWVVPGGKVFLLIAAGILLIGVGAFAWKAWILERWPRAEGAVVSARVERASSDDQTICSAVYSVRYSVRGTDFTTETGGHTFSGDCVGVEADAAAAPGRKVVTLYDEDNPRGAYVDPGFNTEFFLVSFILTIMSLAFAMVGLATWKLGSWMDKRGIELP
ncbi:MAG TPA: DUF3592 domain-containing protein [Candidatus Acidoferrum sp.]|nr:DUF3592 domain-containing protein [Candidatus Acidoferrum sp.]